MSDDEQREATAAWTADRAREALAHPDAEAGTSEGQMKSWLVDDDYYGPLLRDVPFADEASRAALLDALEGIIGGSLPLLLKLSGAQEKCDQIAGVLMARLCPEHATPIRDVTEMAAALGQGRRVVWVRDEIRARNQLEMMTLLMIKGNIINRLPMVILYERPRTAGRAGRSGSRPRGDKSVVVLCCRPAPVGAVEAP